MKRLGGRSGWDGHLLLLYHAESQRRAGVEAWARRGLDLGAKILYIEPPQESQPRSLLGVLGDRADARRAFDRGQIQVFTADDSAYDPAWQALVVEEALDQGYPSVRWSGEARTAWSVMSRVRHAHVERATEVLCRSQPVSVMCQYSAREHLEALRDVCKAHTGLRDRLFEASPFEGGVVVAGEIDRSNQDILSSLVHAMTSNWETDLFVVDLHGMDFIDVGGTRALMAGTLLYRTRGGRVALRSPQPHVDRLMRMLGVDRTPGILTEEA